MRILLPTMRDPGQIGGTSTHIAMLSRGLEELGHQVHALFVGGAIPAPVRSAGLIWPAGALNRVRKGWGMMYAAETRGRLLARVTAAELERAERAGTPWEVLNAQEVYSVPHLREVADRHRVPLVLTLHGYPLYESVSEGYSAASQMGRGYLMRAEMRALRLADAVVTVDTRLYRHALRLVPERADSIYTLMNFVDTSAFAAESDPAVEEKLRRDLRAAWQVPEGRIVLFCPRRLVKKNGVIYPSLALAAMEQGDRARFLLLHAGEGGERPEIERIVSENQLEDKVRLLGGHGPDVIRQLYRLCDIVLVPSVHSENVEEATSLSALEAMASGRPLIAGAVGGLAEMVVDGENGLLVPADEKALAAAILRLAAAPELGARLASKARDYVVEKHSHLRAAAAYIEVYRRVRQTPAAAEVVAVAVSPAPPVADPLADAQPDRLPAPQWPSISVLGFPLDIVSLEEAARWAVARASGPAGTGRTALAVSFNPELVIRAQSDPAVAEMMWATDLSYPDGVGATWAAARQGARGAVAGDEASDAVERVAGIDLAQRILELSAEEGLSVYLLGSAEGVAAEAARRQKELLPGLNIVGTHHGYFSRDDESAIVATIRAAGPAILLVALGAPRQELFLYRYRDQLGARVALGVGGSLDVWAGKVKRAPAWTQRAKVEWLYRLASDPRRLRRQMSLPKYAVQVVRWSPEDYGPPRRRRPSEPENPGSRDKGGTA
jgi:exopolysaccharide biosynthesis WecB/TagA/CpsF family protein